MTSPHSKSYLDTVFSNRALLSLCVEQRAVLAIVCMSGVFISYPLVLYFEEGGPTELARKQAEQSSCLSVPIAEVIVMRSLSPMLCGYRG